MTFLVVLLCSCLLIWLTLCFLLSTAQCLPIAQIGIVANVCTVRFVSRNGWFPAWSTVLVTSAAVFGLFSGGLVYSSKISEAEERLVKAYLHSDVLSLFLASSPGYANAPTNLLENASCEKGAGSAVDNKALSIWLQRLLQTQTTNDNLKDPSHPHAVLSKVFGVIENDKAPFFRSVSYKIGCLSTLELVLRLSEAIGSKAGVWGKLEEEALVAELAAALARLPGTLASGKSAPAAFAEMGNCPSDPLARCRKDYLRIMKTILDDKSVPVDVREFRLDSRLVSIIRGRIGQGFTFFRPDEISSDALLQALFSRTNVVNKLDEKRKELEENSELRQQLDFYISFVRALLSAVGQDPEVKDASYTISFWMGLARPIRESAFSSPIDVAAHLL